MSCRDWATHSLPTLILLSIFLYVDRIVRQEVIFDSSALTCTVFVTHILNVCRSKIAHIDPRATSAVVESIISSSVAVSNYTTIPSSSAAAAAVPELLLLSSTSSDPTLPVQLLPPHHGEQQRSWWWQQQLILAAYCFTSVLLLLNVDISVFAAPPKSSCMPVLPLSFLGHQQQHPPTLSSLRVSTIVLHCLLVGTLLQVPVEKDGFMLPWKIMARSFLFTVLCICWTYAVGIHEVSFCSKFVLETLIHKVSILPMPSLLSCLLAHVSFIDQASMQIRSYPYFYNPVLQRQYVQPFTPCQLRFLALLFLDGWFLLATSLTMLVVVGRQLSNLASTLSVSATTNSAAASARNAAASAASHASSMPILLQDSDDADEEASASTVAIQLMASSSRHPQLQLVNSLKSHLPPSQQEGFIHHNNNHYTLQQQQQLPPIMTPPVDPHPPPACLSSGTALHQQQQMQHEDETAAMFRMARKAAASKLGEMI